MAKPKGTPRFNPRGGDRRGKTPAGQRPSSSVWYGLAFVLVLVLAQTYYLMPAGQPIPYSEFKTLLKNGPGRRGDHRRSDDSRHAQAAARRRSEEVEDSSPTTRVEDPKLTEELEARGVKYTGEIASRWLPELLGWILPLVFFIAI